MANYELHDEKDDHFVVMGPDKKAFSVAKMGLSPEMISKIKSLKPQHYAFGTGDAGSEESDASEESDTPVDPTEHPEALQAEPVSDAEAAAPAAQPVGQTSPSPLEQLANAPDQTNPAASAVPGAATTPQLPGALGQYAAAQGKAIDVGAQIQKQQAEANAKIYDEYIRQVQAEHQEYQKQRAQNQAEHQQLHDAIMNAKIDPHRLWHEAGTGNKILAGIGILLGGIGGMSTGTNPVIESMNRTMDKDVEAQKINLGKQQSLLSENLRQYGDINTAEAATRQQLNTIAQAQIARAAAVAGTPLAMQQAQLAKAQLGIQNSMLANTVALNQTKAKLLGTGTAAGGVPTAQLPYQLQNDPEFQKRAVDTGGITYSARTPEDATKLKGMHALYTPITEGIGKLQQLGPKAAIPGTSDHAKAIAAVNALAEDINKFNGNTRFTDFQKDEIANQLKNPANLKQLVTGNAMNTDLLNSLNTKLESERAQRLVGYGKGGPAGGRSSLVYDSRVTKR